MDTIFKLSFFLYKSKRLINGQIPIYLKIRNSEGMFCISTKICTYEKDWDGKKHRIKGNSKEVSSKNEALSTILANVRNSIGRFSLVESNITLLKLKNEVSGINNKTTTVLLLFQEIIDNIKFLQGKDYTLSTLKKYQLTCDRIAEFILIKYKQKDLLLTDLDFKFISDFEQFLKVNYSNRQGTVYKHCQRLIMISRLAVKNNYIQKHPFDGFKITLPPKNITYLTKSDLDKLEAKQFSTERLNNIKYAFLFCCYSGLAYNEVKSLLMLNIVKENDDELWINMTRRKTKKPYHVPLLPRAIQILNMYNNHVCRQQGKALPILSNVKFNEYLKEIADLCDFNVKLTTHVARKTFAVTILLVNGVSIPTVAALLNHASISVTMSTYSDIIPSEVIREFKVLKNYLKRPLPPIKWNSLQPILIY
jgi:integrase